MSAGAAGGPALSADDWREMAHFAAKDEFPDRHLSERVATHAYWMFEAGHDRAAEGAALVALANHALPDGDPRKITRADVEVLLLVARRLGDPRWPLAQGYRSRVEAIAAKLAALLPPEGA